MQNIDSRDQPIPDIFTLIKIIWRVRKVLLAVFLGTIVLVSTLWYLYGAYAPASLNMEVAFKSTPRSLTLSPVVPKLVNDLLETEDVRDRVEYFLKEERPARKIKILSATAEHNVVKLNLRIQPKPRGESELKDIQKAIDEALSRMLGGYRQQFLELKDAQIQNHLKLHQLKMEAVNLFLAHSNNGKEERQAVMEGVISDASRSRNMEIISLLLTSVPNEVPQKGLIISSAMDTVREIDRVDAKTNGMAEFLRLKSVQQLIELEERIFIEFPMSDEKLEFNIKKFLLVLVASCTLSVLLTIFLACVHNFYVNHKEFFEKALR